MQTLASNRWTRKHCSINCTSTSSEREKTILQQIFETDSAVTVQETSDLKSYADSYRQPVIQNKVLSYIQIRTTRKISAKEKKHYYTTMFRTWQNLRMRLNLQTQNWISQWITNYRTNKLMSFFVNLFSVSTHNATVLLQSQKEERVPLPKTSALVSQIKVPQDWWNKLQYSIYISFSYVTGNANCCMTDNANSENTTQFIQL